MADGPMAESAAPSAVNATLQHFVTDLAGNPAFAQVVATLRQGGTALVDGVVGGSCALSVAALAEQNPSGLLVVCDQRQTVDVLMDDMRLFYSGPILGFPAWENAPGERLVFDETYSERLRTLKRLLSTDAPSPVVVCAISSLLQPVPHPSAVRAHSRTVAVGEVVPADALIEWLTHHGFQPTSGVRLAGEFAARGGILDVFTADGDAPVRIEWFDDEITSIRCFDVDSQRSLRQQDSIDITVFPAQATGGDHPLRGGESATQLTAYMAAGAWSVLCEPDAVDEAGRRYGERQADTSPLFTVSRTYSELQRRGLVSLAALARSSEAVYCPLSTQTVERFSGDLARVRHELEAEAEHQDVYLVCATPAEMERLGEVFEGSPLQAAGRLHFVQGRLSAGFHLLEEQALLLGGSELFRRTDVRRRKRHGGGKKIDSFLDLREGDLVVHLVHGIGRYRGLEQLQREHQVEDHLAIEFAGGTRVFVPATKIDLVQKYVGATKARPRLATIGSALWQKRRKAAERAVADMAADLLEIHAQRAARPGQACGDDTHWQAEFDASFPYEETEDQHQAILAIKADLQRPVPMDRLLCGDVGFGKTEVAMRAAFKAVDNGYQVGVLVPTTVLAEQHFHTFSERMAEFPFSIARLSRFCTSAQSREIVEGVKSGAIDIVIGTHRLASKDVDFHNLGLLIIDEEQRFGVGVKEKLKSLRSTVDVLTMSATPIPRTLHMALTGMRDISNLETPPQDRIAVDTRISRWDDTLIRHAILRELNRGGQVYFVHNRVKDMERVRQKLESLVPEARIGVGHGQMAEGALEEIMVGFVQHRFDVLLATTIIESGLDIPNANTIFIDGADAYGLSDLHQLRGRVGRYKHHAYCYLLLEPQKHITPDAAKRLRAIEEFSQMGAGFAIAMRDLEFRGAGNILGTQQSGHIAAVGYELYCELLEAAVRKLQRLPPRMKVDVNIDLPGDAFLPDAYVSDLRAKVDVYRRLSRVTSSEEVQDIREELRDRFGELPRPVLQLLSIAELKIDAAVWQIESIQVESQDRRDYLVLDYRDAARIRQLAQSQGPRLRIVDGTQAYVPLDSGADNAANVLATAKSVLRPD